MCFPERVTHSCPGLPRTHDHEPSRTLQLPSGGVLSPTIRRLQGRERGLEYNTMSGRYAEFLETEVLPLVEAKCQVKLTREPEGRATMGGSSDGSCALIMAGYHPGLYHRVLTYSGTYVNQQWPSNPATPHGVVNFPAISSVRAACSRKIRVHSESTASDSPGKSRELSPVWTGGKDPGPWRVGRETPSAMEQTVVPTATPRPQATVERETNLRGACVGDVACCRWLSRD